MRVAVIGESPGDAAGVAVLARAVLGPEHTVILSPLRSLPGVNGVFSSLPALLAGLYFGDHADALIVTIDSDNMLLHPAGVAECSETSCRLCRLRSQVAA